MSCVTFKGIFRNVKGKFEFQTSRRKITGDKEEENMSFRHSLTLQTPQQQISSTAHTKVKKFHKTNSNNDSLTDT
jgi:hypothetical protein